MNADLYAHIFILFMLGSLVSIFVVGAYGLITGRAKTVTKLEEGDPPIPIDPRSITLAFVGLPAGAVADINRYYQPRLWSDQIETKFVTFIVNEGGNGEPDVESIPRALEEHGLSSRSSVVINEVNLFLEGDSSQEKMFVGFAFREGKPRIIFPYNDACILKDSETT
jgi:hypothetical protein